MYALLSQVSLKLRTSIWKSGTAHPAAWILLEIHSTSRSASEWKRTVCSPRVSPGVQAIFRLRRAAAFDHLTQLTGMKVKEQFWMRWVEEETPPGSGSGHDILPGLPRKRVPDPYAPCILVVDDDVEIQRLFSRILEEAGYF